MRPEHISGSGIVRSHALEWPTSRQLMWRSVRGCATSRPACGAVAMSVYGCSVRTGASWRTMPTRDGCRGRRHIPLSRVRLAASALACRCGRIHDAAAMFWTRRRPGSRLARHTEGVLLLTAAAGLLARSERLRFVQSKTVSCVIRARTRAIAGPPSFTPRPNGPAASLTEPGTVQQPPPSQRGQDGPLGLIDRPAGRPYGHRQEELRSLRPLRRLGRHPQPVVERWRAMPHPGADAQAIARRGADGPLTFAGSRGAPAGLSEADLPAWDALERHASPPLVNRRRARAREAARLRAAEALDMLATRNCS